MAKVDYSAVGRRKKAVARVRLVAGDGKVTINKRDIDNYFGLETLKMTVRQPLTLTGTTSFDVLVNVCGGGVSGQAGAIRHGISRALCKADPELRAALKKAGFLTRDPRMKERKKYGFSSRAPVQQALSFLLYQGFYYPMAVWQSWGVFLCVDFVQKICLCENRGKPCRVSIFRSF